MSRVERLHREKVTRYSIRKYSFGAASVAVAALFMFLGNGAVSANELSKQDTPSVEAPVPASEAKPTLVESTPAVQPILGESTAKPAEPTTPALDKSELTKLISEIETKLSNGSYANKTEESVAVLKADLEAAKATLANVTTQAELKKAYSKLVTTVNTKLKAKPVEKKETPAVDTTNGQPTVGKKAENTEKNPDSNSIENTGSHDPRNDQPIPEGIQFRAPIAYAENANGTAYGNSNTYITSGVKNSSEPGTAKDIASRIMKYKTRFNTDATGKITSVDWMIYYNDYVENWDRSYGIGGKVSRNYIQIPKEVNMPTEIKRVHYIAETKFGRPQDLKGADGLSSVVTFDNPEPGKVGNAPLARNGIETFSRDSWNSYSRGYDILSGNTNDYFKDAATRVPETKAIVEANALPGPEKRVIWDQSNTGENARDAYVWEFRTTVPDTTTNEQLKNMKAVMGSFRIGAVGVDHGLHTIAANPVNLSKADVTPPKAKDQTVKAGQTPDPKKSIENFNDLPQGTTVKYRETVNTQNPGEQQVTAVVTYPDTSTKEVRVNVIVEKEAVAAPTVNTTIKASGSIPDSVPSSDSELTGTGIPRATVKVTVKNPETGAVISVKTAVVGEDGTWRLPLEEGLNSNTQLPGASEAARRFFAPKNPVEVTQVVNGVESEPRAVSVAVGESKILPSAAAKDGASVVAGAKEVTVTVPHDAGRAYFFYTKKGATSTTEVALEQSQNGWSIVNNGDKATIKSVDKGVSVHTITLTMNEDAPFQEGTDKLEIISHNGPSSPPSRLGRYKINVTNEKPVVSSATNSDVTTVTAGGTVDLSTLAKVTDHEDDKNATLGTKGTPRVVSINGDTNKTTLEAADLATPGTYTVKYKAVDSQGKESDEYTHTVTVQDTTAPAKPVVETDLTGKAGTKDPVVVDAEPGSTVKLLDKDGNELGEAVAGDNGKATITPTKDIPAGNVTATATDPAGNVSEASEPKEATPAKDTTAPVTPVKPVTPAKTEVKDPANLTDAEKAKVAEEVKKSNPTATDVKVGKDGTTTVTFPDGSTAVIPAAKAVAKANDSEGVKDPSATAVKDPSNLTNADKAKAASNTSQATSSQANARKVAKELPNTGTADSTVAMVAAAASALLGLGLAGRRRKEDEEA